MPANDPLTSQLFGTHSQTPTPKESSDLYILKPISNEKEKRVAYLNSDILNKYSIDDGHLIVLQSGKCKCVVTVRKSAEVESKYCLLDGLSLFLLSAKYGQYVKFCKGAQILTMAAEKIIIQYDDTFEHYLLYKESSKLAKEHARKLLKEIPYFNDHMPLQQGLKVKKILPSIIAAFHYVYLVSLATELQLEQCEESMLSDKLRNTQLFGKPKTLTSPLSQKTKRASPSPKPKISHLISNHNSKVAKDIKDTIEEPIQSNHCQINLAMIGGLNSEKELLKRTFQLPLQYPDLFKKFNVSPAKGILLYGPPGTGKTMLMRALSNELGISYQSINGPAVVGKFQGETESRIREIFNTAKANAPSIVFIDEIDALAPNRDKDDISEADSRAVACLLTEMDGLVSNETSGFVFVLAATNRLNAIDPALRRPGRFEKEIEIGIPSRDVRLEIMRIMLKTIPSNLSDSEIASLADLTHAYVGADLVALCREASIAAIERSILCSKKEQSSNEVEQVTMKDFQDAMHLVQSSVMREIYLETPKVYWSDIGGNEQTKKRLQEAIQWPISKKDQFVKLGIEPLKGILLYGPPGCSKTLLAKAAATESHLNFIAVKGPELISKYVGDSEKAVREVFRKARQASPSIIFFDEIDSLCSDSSNQLHQSSSGHGTERVLATLLNEMDGIEVLTDVFILAATNRPKALDPALLRPGRFDQRIYVGLPDEKARKEILLVKTKKMNLDQDVSIDHLAESTDSFSGAELAALCQNSGLNAMRREEEVTSIKMQDFTMALDAIKPNTKKSEEYFWNL